MGIGRVEYITELLADVDILCIQEHWLFEEQINNLENKIDNVFVYGVSGMDEQVLINGRPFDGCAIIWDRAQSRRLCAV